MKRTSTGEYAKSTLAYSPNTLNALCVPSHPPPMHPPIFHTKFKDIVQPKKRGVKRGTIQFVLTSYTIADIFLDTRKGLISRRKFATKNLKARCDVA